MTRTDDATNFSQPTIAIGNSEQGSSPFNNCYPWSKIVKKTIDNQALIEIPKFWFKWTKNGSTMKLQISDKPVYGFHVSPMHADRGDGVGERDLAYIGRYKCCQDWKSKKNQAPIVSKTIGESREGIAALGNGYYQQDYAAFWTIRMLFLVEFATWDGQSILKNTTDWNSMGEILTGSSSTMTYHTGITQDGHGTIYRWIEDPWENVLEWVDGIYYNSSNVYCINNPKNFATGSNGVKIGSRITTSGYIASWAIPSTTGYEWALIPSTTTTNKTVICDEYYYSSNGTVLYTSGSRLAWEAHGPFFLYTDFTALSTSAYMTSRLMYLPG